MTALVIPLAMTTRMEVMRRNKVMTLIAGVILMSMIRVLMSMRLAACAILGITMRPYTDTPKRSFINVRESRRVM